jgi:hypothetical protein
VEGGELMSSPASPLIIWQLPISNFMPPGGVEWRPHKYVPLPAIGATSVVVSRKIPTGSNAMLNRLANEFVGGGFQQGAGGVQWFLYIDYNELVPAPNFNLITASLGSVNNPTILNGIRVKEGLTVALVVKNVSIVVAGQQIGGLLGGYDYPKALEPQGFSF